MKRLSWANKEGYFLPNHRLKWQEYLTPQTNIFIANRSLYSDDLTCFIEGHEKSETQKV